MMSRHILHLLAPVSMLALAGCLSTPADPPPDPGFLSPDATATVALGAVAFDSTARQAVAASSEVDQASGAFTLGTLSGTLSEDRADGTLDQGGIVTLEAGQTDFAVAYVATSGEDRTVGILGLPTEGADMPPAGQVSYSGTATVLIEDSNAIYELTGAASLEASFDAGIVTTTLDDLSGSQTIGLTAPVAVSDVGVLTVTGSTIEGTTFSGGTPSLASEQIGALSGSETSSLEGAFFGPGADELGAALVIDDSAAGSVTVFGTILAD